MVANCSAIQPPQADALIRLLRVLLSVRQPALHRRGPRGLEGLQSEAVKALTLAELRLPMMFFDFVVHPLLHLFQDEGQCHDLT